jgi:ubiquitin C-terminal hydrolase
MGGLGGGHYTADCVNRDDGRWHNFNDSRVGPQSPTGLSGSSAYVLFYVRRD